MQCVQALIVTTENRHLTDEAEIEKALQLGEYIKNGEPSVQRSGWVTTPAIVVSVWMLFRCLAYGCPMITELVVQDVIGVDQLVTEYTVLIACIVETLALYSLRKYRHLKRMYGSDRES